MINEKKHLCLGEIYREHGIHGHCKFYSYSSDDLNLIEDQEYILQNPDGQEITTHIESTAVIGRYFLIKFDVFSNPEEIKKWRKSQLWIKKSQLVQSDDEMYDFEWVDYSVFDVSGNKIGVIEHLEYTPLPNFSVITKDNKSVLIPYVKEWMIEFDKDKKKLIMQLPEGLV